MTDEQINIAIAKACGWKFIADYCHGANDPPEYTTVTPDGRHLCGYYPDYCNDLNAMHEAEALIIKLGHRAIRTYEDLLQKQIANIVFATDRQRCEAYLRTLGIWIE